MFIFFSKALRVNLIEIENPWDSFTVSRMRQRVAPLFSIFTAVISVEQLNNVRYRAKFFRWEVQSGEIFIHLIRKAKRRGPWSTVFCDDIKAREGGKKPIASFTSLENLISLQNFAPRFRVPAVLCFWQERSLVFWENFTSASVPTMMSQD